MRYKPKNKEIQEQKRHANLRYLLSFFRSGHTFQKINSLEPETGITMEPLTTLEYILVL